MKRDRPTRFELWKVAAGHTFFPASNEAARQLLEPGAKLVWWVHARSWDEARRRMHRHLGWAPYRPAKIVAAAPPGTHVQRSEKRPT